MANVTRNIPWARLGFESVLIVVSILVAFAIDSWWSDRQDSTEGQELLRQLEGEFEANVAQLSEKCALHAEARAAGLRFLAITGPQADVRDLDIDVIRDDLLSILYNYTFDPHTGVLSSIIHSGKLDLIEPEELRVELASWPARYEDLSEDEQAVVAISRGELTDHKNAFLAFRDFMPIAREAGSSKFTSDIDGMLRDRRFENTIALKVGRLTFLLGYCDETEAQLMHTLSLIDSGAR